MRRPDLRIRVDIEVDVLRLARSSTQVFVFALFFSRVHDGEMIGTRPYELGIKLVYAATKCVHDRVG